jgi:ABC-type phosphate transport system substrate-binding protein
MLKRLICIVLMCACLNTQAANSTVIAIIVNQNNPIKNMDEGELSLIYLSKKLYFSNGRRIAAINLPAHSPLRKDFSSFLFGNLPESQSAYWNEAYYHGIKPPHVVGSQESALKFIEITPNGIAYIDACLLTENVKAIAYIDKNKHALVLETEIDCN